MRVLFLSHRTLPGGSISSLAEAVEALSGKGFDVHVVVPGEGPLREELETRGASVVTTSPYPWWLTASSVSLRGRVRLATRFVRRSIGPTRELTSVVRSVRPDVVVTNTLAFPHGAVAARRSGVPHVWYAREYVHAPHAFQFLFPARVGFALVDRLSARVVCCSHALADHLSHHIQPRKLDAVHAAFVLPEADVTATASTPSSPLRLLMLSRFDEEKGQQDAIRAVATLADQGREVSLVLAGTNETGQEPRFRQLVQELGVTQRVEFREPSARPQDLIAEADVVVMCSRAEGFSRVTIESMKLGTPVIATSIPSTREQVQDGVTGFLYEAGDVAALSRTIAQLDDDRASLAAVGASSRRWAETNFSLERYGNELGRVLTEAVQDRRSRSSPRQRLLR